MKKQFSARAIQRASGCKPLPEHQMRFHLGAVNAGLDALQHADGVQIHAWEAISDAINSLAALGEIGLITDASGEIDRAKNAMGDAGERYHKTGALRLNGAGLQTVRQLLEDYEEVVRGLTERQFLQACRHATKRINEIRRGHVGAGDRVVSL